jgi:hypothetical protein
MQLLLLNLDTGTVEQRCDVIRTRGCSLAPYDVSPALSYGFYGAMASSLDPVHCIFNATFTGCTLMASSEGA